MRNTLDLDEVGDGGCKRDLDTMPVPNFEYKVQGKHLLIKRSCINTDHPDSVEKHCDIVQSTLDYHDFRMCREQFIDEWEFYEQSVMGSMIYMNVVRINKCGY